MSSIYQNEGNRGLYKFVEWIELMGFSLVATGGMYLLYTNYCQSLFCQSISPDQLTFNLSIKVIVVMAAIINSLRIGLLYNLTDPDRHVEYLFYTSLGFMAASFIIFGFNFVAFDQLTGRKITFDPYFFAYISTFGATLLLYLGERNIWNKSNLVVKFRMSLSFLLLVLIIINPTLALLSSMILVPLQVLSPMLMSKHLNKN
jgi:hypothetical protein